MISTAHCDTPLGVVRLAQRQGALTGLWLERQKFRFPPREEVREQDTPVTDIAKQWLKEYFAGHRPELTSIRLAPEGSEFQLAVWRLLLKIPYGSVDTYGHIAGLVAKVLGKKRMSAQAVGGAVGRNPIALMIPCHRVIGSDGSLTGYAGGLDIKLHLLRLEGVNPALFKQNNINNINCINNK